MFQKRCLIPIFSLNLFRRSDYSMHLNTCRQRSTSTRSLGLASRAMTRETRVFTWWRRCFTTTTPSHPPREMLKVILSDGGIYIRFCSVKVFVSGNVGINDKKLWKERPKFIHDEQQQSSPPLDFIFGRIGLNVTLKPFISIYKYLHHLLFRIALNSFNSFYGNVCALLMNRCDNMAERGKTSQFSYVLLNDITQFKHVMEESLSSLLKLTCPFALSMYLVFCHYDNILNKYNSTIHNLFQLFKKFY